MSKSNEEYMREIRNIQPAHPLVYERIEQILTEKDAEVVEAVKINQSKLQTFCGLYASLNRDKCSEHVYGTNGADKIQKKLDFIWEQIEALTHPTKQTED